MNTDVVQNSVVAAIVTYGDRVALCTAVCQAAVLAGASSLLVVANGISSDSLATLESARAKGFGVPFHLLINDTNTGSAGGFQDALASARELGEWIWVLDDDNVPRVDALTIALEKAASHGYHAMAMLRDSDIAHASIRDGMRPEQVYARPGAFFGVDVQSRLKSAILRNRKKDIPHTKESLKGDPSVPQASYGGLLMRSSILDVVDPPVRDFYLYFDDVEFTRRMVSTGVAIHFIAEACVDDIDTKWADTSDGGGYMRAMVAAADSRKTFYSYRNSTYLEWCQSTGRTRFRFLLNLTVYTLKVAAVAGPWSDYMKLYLRAVVHGMRGRLGIVALKELEGP